MSLNRCLLSCGFLLAVGKMPKREPIRKSDRAICDRSIMEQWLYGSCEEKAQDDIDECRGEGEAVAIVLSWLLGKN